MIIQELNGLLDHIVIKFTNYPYILTSQLLSDYVFKQSPRNQKEAINIIIDGLKSHSLSYGHRRRSNDERITLPAECGGNEIVIECFNQLQTFPRNDYAFELIGLIMDNPHDKEKHWKAYIPSLSGKKLTKWLRYAEYLQILDKLDEETIERIVSAESESFPERLQILLNANRFDIIDKKIELKEQALLSILNSDKYTTHSSESNSLHFLTLTLHPFILASTIKNTDLKYVYSDYLNKRFQYSLHENHGEQIAHFPVNDIIDKKISKFRELIKAVLNEEISYWRKHIDPWDTIVERGRDVFGEKWCFSIVAVISAGIKSKESYKDCHDITDKNKSLCKRVRFARMKSGNVKYWNTQLQQTEFLKLTILVFLTWATPRTICYLLSLLSSKIGLLSKDEYLIMVDAISKTSMISKFTKQDQKILEKGIRDNKTPNNLIYLLSCRTSHERRGKFIYEFINDYSGIPAEALNSKLDYLSQKFYNKPTDNAVLSEIKECYSKLGDLNPARDYIVHRDLDNIKIPLDTSKEIMNKCKYYPREVIAIAEMSCRSEANKLLKPVGEIAEKEKWFN